MKNLLLSFFNGLLPGFYNGRPLLYEDSQYSEAFSKLISYSENTEKKMSILSQGRDYKLSWFGSNNTGKTD